MSGLFASKKVCITVSFAIPLPTSDLFPFLLPGRNVLSLLTVGAAVPFLQSA